MRLQRALNQTGDTIVEVMLALAALSALLGTSYATAARAQKVSQLNQDRADATKLAESQLELLRNYRDHNSVDDAKTQLAGGPMCIDSGGNFKLPTDPACTSTFFKYSITYGSANNAFSAQTTWTGARGEANQVNLEFRLQ